MSAEAATSSSKEESIGINLVGRRCAVFWKSENTWYDGFIDKFDSELDQAMQPPYHIQYDDGEDDWITYPGSHITLENPTQPSSSSSEDNNIMELPSDSFSPRSNNSRQLRSTLELVASYCSTTSTITKVQHDTCLHSVHPPIIIRSNQEECGVLPISFLPQVHVLMYRFEASAFETKKKDTTIDVSDLEISSNILKKLIESVRGNVTKISTHDILRYFVGACKLGLTNQINRLMTMIREDTGTGMLDITSLSVSDIKFILEMAANNCHQAQSAINKLRKDVETTQKVCGKFWKFSSSSSSSSNNSNNSNNSDNNRSDSKWNSVQNVVHEEDTPPEDLSRTKLARRDLIIDELIQTERSYLSQLERMEKIFKQRLLQMAECKLVWKTSAKKGAPPVITVEQVTTIFGVSLSLYSLHSTLYNRMAGAQSTASNKKRTSLVAQDIGIVLGKLCLF